MGLYTLRDSQWWTVVLVTSLYSHQSKLSNLWIAEICDVMLVAVDNVHLGIELRKYGLNAKS